MTQNADKVVIVPELFSVRFIASRMLPARCLVIYLPAVQVGDEHVQMVVRAQWASGLMGRLTGQL